MNIHLGTDHAGFEHKEELKKWLIEHKYTPIDHGALKLNPDDDYPDYIIPAVYSAVKNNELAIIFGGSGQGEAIAANKVSGARAVVLYSNNSEIVRLSREHNDTNVLSIGARFVDKDEMIQSVQLWLETDFSGNERHIRRLGKIKYYEQR